jgi:hypothetical protein
MKRILRVVFVKQEIIFFLSSMSRKSQIWMLDMKRGGEGQQLTDWDPGIEEYERLWSSL